MVDNPVIIMPPDADREGFIASTFEMSYDKAERDFKEVSGLLQVYEKLIEAGE